MNRREALKKSILSIVLLTTSGCSRMRNRNNTDDKNKINLINKSDGAVTIKIIITEKKNKENIYENRTKITPDEPETQSALIQPGVYKVEVNVTNGPKNSSTWEVAEGSESGLDIEIYQNRIQFYEWDD